MFELLYFQIIEYYSVLKSNVLSRNENTWRKFKGLLQSERNQMKRIYAIWLEGYGIVEKQTNQEDSENISDCQKQRVGKDK